MCLLCGTDAEQLQIRLYDHLRLNVTLPTYEGGGKSVHGEGLQVERSLKPRLQLPTNIVPVERGHNMMLVSDVIPVERSEHEAFPYISFPYIKKKKYWGKMVFHC